MIVLVREHCAFNNEICLCNKVYYSNTIIITILMQTLIPICRFGNIPSPQFCIKTSSENFHMVLRKVVDNLL